METAENGGKSGWLPRAYSASHGSLHYTGPAMKKWLGRIALLLVFAIAGCGGGGGSSDSVSAPPATHTVAATASSGGSIIPASQTVEEGDKTEFEVTPEAGYSVDQVVGCGGNLNRSTYTTGAITGSCQVEASFRRSTYLVSATAGIGGSVDPASQTVDHGATTTFSVSPDIGYSIDTVVGCGGSLDGTIYTTGAITEVCTVNAIFSGQSPRNLEATAGEQEVELRWDAVHGSDSYTLYYATERGIQPADFGIWMSQHGGVMVEDVTSPHIVENLSRVTEYFFVVTATIPGQESGPSNEVSAVPRLHYGALNDTGIDWCADGTRNFRTCPVVGFPGQDAEFGRDAAAREGTLEKVGGGAAGFDYTKIANNGSVLPASAALGNDPNDWACTRDNVTGLIWEVKTTGGGLRDRNNTYTWYQPDGPNMYRPGTQNGGSCTGSSCDTTGFVQAVNAQGLCGATDWRLPAVGELHSIVHHGRLSPAVDTIFFPNTLSSFFWSTSAELGNSAGAKGVSFSTGSVEWAFKNFSHGVRLVRGGQ